MDRRGCDSAGVFAPGLHTATIWPFTIEVPGKKQETRYMIFKGRNRDGFSLPPIIIGSIAAPLTFGGRARRMCYGFLLQPTH